MVIIHRHVQACDFCERAQEFLLRDEASHNLMLGLCGALTASPGPCLACMATAEDAGRVIGAAVRTPPWHLVLSKMPGHAAVRLARDMHATREPLPGVNGPSAVAEAFTRAWSALTGSEALERRRLGIYSLETVHPALRAPGVLRHATPGDLETVLRWYRAFVDEVLEDRPRPAEIARLERRVRERGVYLWEKEGPVSMACAGNRTPNGVRVSGVYTPPDLRGHGYASACVAALSQRMLDEGRRYCFLYTDLANPTSNHIYKTIGYVPVCDVTEYAL